MIRMESCHTYQSETGDAQLCVAQLLIENTTERMRLKCTVDCLLECFESSLTVVRFAANDNTSVYEEQDEDSTSWGCSSSSGFDDELSVASNGQGIKKKNTSSYAIEKYFFQSRQNSTINASSLPTAEQISACIHATYKDKDLVICQTNLRDDRSLYKQQTRDVCFLDDTMKPSLRGGSVKQGSQILHSCLSLQQQSYKHQLSVPSIAIVLFVHEKHISPYEKYLQFPPWKFHHKIELANTNRQHIQSMAKQEYYHLGAGLPLWAVCPVHFGNQHLRFTFFTRNYEKMVQFYQLVTGRNMSYVKKHFCLFDLCSKNGTETDIQLAFKYTPSLQPMPLDKTILHIKLKSAMKYLEPLLPCKPQKLSTPGCYLIYDPDGNKLVLEEVPVQSVQSCNAALSKPTTEKVDDWPSDRSSDSGQHSFMLEPVSDIESIDDPQFSMRTQYPTLVQNYLDSQTITDSSTNATAWGNINRKAKIHDNQAKIHDNHLGRRVRSIVSTTSIPNKSKIHLLEDTGPLRRFSKATLLTLTDMNEKHNWKL